MNSDMQTHNFKKGTAHTPDDYSNTDTHNVEKSTRRTPAPRMLLTLPAEIRLKIFEYALTDDINGCPHGLNEDLPTVDYHDQGFRPFIVPNPRLVLLSVCRAFYTEIRPLPTFYVLKFCTVMHQRRLMQSSRPCGPPVNSQQAWEARAMTLRERQQTICRRFRYVECGLSPAFYRQLDDLDLDDQGKEASARGTFGGLLRFNSKTTWNRFTRVENDAIDGGVKYVLQWNWMEPGVEISESESGNGGDDENPPDIA